MRPGQAQGPHAHVPGPPPERRVDQVDAVVEDVAPLADEVRVTRASLPSTVSRKVMIQAQTRPQPNWPGPEQPEGRQHQQEADRRSPGWASSCARAHQRVTIRAGTGQTYLVTRSVTPLYEPWNRRFSTATRVVGRQAHQHRRLALAQGAVVGRAQLQGGQAGLDQGGDVLAGVQAHDGLAGSGGGDVDRPRCGPSRRPGPRRAARPGRLISDSSNTQPASTTTTSPLMKTVSRPGLDQSQAAVDARQPLGRGHPPEARSAPVRP